MPGFGRTPAPPFVDAGFLADPYPAYASLRESGPIHWSEEFLGGAWLLTRYADVDSVLRDSERYSAQRTGGWVMRSGDGAQRELKDFQALFARAMLFVDEPDHQRLRRVMNAGFRGDALERLRPRIAGWIEQRLAIVDARAGFDFIEAVARPLPAQVIAALMGIEDAEHGGFIAWSDDLATFIGAARPTLEHARRAQTSLLAMARFFEPLAQRRRRAPRDDMISRLVQAEADGDIATNGEMLAQCAMLLFAGHETTRNLLGNGLQALLEEPDAWRQLQADGSLLPMAVRELLRYDSPVQYTGRRVRIRHVLHGRQLERGDLVVALIGAANRDPARFEQPERLDFGRRTGMALSFGAGPHVCIGAALALMEAQLVFAEVLRRWPTLHLVEPTPCWGTNPVYRGLARLRVAV